MGSLIFKNNPRILASAAVGGPFEAKGALAQDFDLLYPDLRLGKKSFEQAQTKMLEDALKLALRKASLQASEIEYLLAGDLLNQITSGSFAARSLGIPFAGLYGACSTSMEGLALAAQLVDSGQAQKVLCGTVSHNAATEKQFRYPTACASQKPPAAQWTVTAAGAAVGGQGALG
ncbi:MAG: stage V sporulation protein AD, partial [Clostridia bacterium]|nr:stage V sporulation protein AD [Clostridia bacterium]